MRVIFLRDELYEHLGRNQGHLFRQDEMYDFEPAFAERFVRRNAAEEIAGGEKANLVGTGGPFVPLNLVQPDADAPVSSAAKRAAAGVKPKAAPLGGPRPGTKAAKAAEAAAANAAAGPKAEPATRSTAPATPASSFEPQASVEPAPQAQSLPLSPPKPGQAG